ncbi:FUSC family protein [Planctomonas deserti]|uniref:FUSC family protein n=1 Tax=Planctomonas deserti TaxID=2144185 RepID=UPI000D33ECD1|nr:FUSC family protein [Planctomonas deserti]
MPAPRARAGPGLLSAAGGIGRSLVSFTPSGRRWPIGLQAGLAISIPVAVGALAGNTGLGLQASMGAFTALYGTRLAPLDRVRLLPLVALGFVASVACGVLFSVTAVTSVLGLILVGSAAVVLCQGFRVGPPGPLMFVLSYGAATLVAAPREHGGAGLDGGRLVLLVAAGCALAYALVAVALLVPSVARRRGEATPARRVLAGFTLAGEARIVTVRLLVAVAATGLVSLPLGTHRGYWITSAAVAILGAGAGRRITATRAVHRVLGTLVGSALVLVVALISPAGLVLALLLGLLQFGVELLVTRHYALALVLITPLAITVGTAAAGVSPDTVLGERIVDTLLGTAIAVLALVALPGRRTATPAA